MPAGALNYFDNKHHPVVLNDTYVMDNHFTDIYQTLSLSTRPARQLVSLRNILFMHTQTIYEYTIRN